MINLLPGKVWLPWIIHTACKTDTSMTSLSVSQNIVVKVQNCIKRLADWEKNAAVYMLLNQIISVFLQLNHSWIRGALHLAVGSFHLNRKLSTKEMPLNLFTTCSRVYSDWLALEIKSKLIGGCTARVFSNKFGISSAFGCLDYTGHAERSNSL